MIIIIFKKLNGNNMVILAYMWIIGLFVMGLGMIIAIVIEKNFDESHPVKKWWRKHIVDTYPYDNDSY